MDPHNFQTSINSNDYFNGGAIELQLPQQLNNHPIQPGPRSYKSRKYRPCDFCRARQVRCSISSAPPCQLCISHGRSCTFVDRPKKKRRPNLAASNGDQSSGSTTSTPTAPLQQYDVSAAQLSPSFISQYSEHSFQSLTGHDVLTESTSSPDQQILVQDGSPIYNLDPYLNMMQSTRIRPLDSQHSTKSARFVGEMGESNPYLLRHYRYNENDECTISKLTYRRIKNSSTQNSFSTQKGEPPVVFMLADDSFAQKGEPRIDDDVLSKAESDLRGMFTDQEALRLIGLFFRFVYPYFPILSKSQVFQSPGVLSPAILHTLPFSLLSAIYATALPFMLYDDFLATTLIHSPPTSHELFRLSWLFIQQELHIPRLATVQACLLLLQRAPTNRYTTDTPWKTSLVGWTVSLAQILGLMKECSDWSSIPVWEMNLRKRLWYGVFVMDKWASLGAGMPSHIHADDFDVLPLEDNDLEASAPDPNQPITESEPDSEHFRLLAELTAILSDIVDSYYTVRATQRTSKDFSLSLELARPLRTRLKAWNDSLPPSMSLRQTEHLDSRGLAQLSGNPSLSLAYIIATMTLFRALLRPLENLTSVEEEATIGSRLAVRAGARECAKEVVEFVENLGRGALDAFWHSWSRANFAIASSFLMQLLVTSEIETESAEIHELVTRWRWAMRIGSGNAGNGLMSLGLLRLDGLLLKNGGAEAGV
ncbi:putative fungal specific transcription factor domain protein [Botrytis fragariae]|uniref:Putative fungal specific transcription factor domain protein n=1 Tax=Botrytis fragariae TaxID=1964551 RepID=A0A8H6AYS2_9HELO|nr:putative fungal specific transcription factor domain protein [Botrytis fragariae]KAF5876088.1 putative fungal specific transcription factor domain protein [Botrytis fragariae]